MAGVVVPIMWMQEDVAKLMGYHGLFLPVFKRVIYNDKLPPQDAKPKAVNVLRRGGKAYENAVHFGNGQRVGSTTFGNEVLYS